MSQLRDDHPGARHHVYQRTANRLPAFPTPAVALTFRNRLFELAPDHGIRLHAYALCSTHYHLALTSDAGQLGAYMAAVLGPVARHANHALVREGGLYRSRYRNRVAPSLSYWRHLVAYIHLNHAPPSRRPQQSSHAAYAHGVGIGGLDVREHLELFGGPTGYRTYLDAVRTHRASTMDRDYLLHLVPLALFHAVRLVGPGRARALVVHWLIAQGEPPGRITVALEITRHQLRRLRSQEPPSRSVAALEQCLARPRDALAAK